MRRGIDRQKLLDRRVVVQFDFPGVRKEHFWLLLSPAEVSLCLEDPGFEANVLVTAELAICVMGGPPG